MYTNSFLVNIVPNLASSVEERDKQITNGWNGESKLSRDGIDMSIVKKTRRVQEDR